MYKCVIGIYFEKFKLKRSSKLSVGEMWNWNCYILQKRILSLIIILENDLVDFYGINFIFII